MAIHEIDIDLTLPAHGLKGLALPDLEDHTEVIDPKDPIEYQRIKQIELGTVPWQTEDTPDVTVISHLSNDGLLGLMSPKDSRLTMSFFSQLFGRDSLNHTLWFMFDSKVAAFRALATVVYRRDSAHNLWAPQGIVGIEVSGNGRMLRVTDFDKRKRSRVEHADDVWNSAGVPLNNIRAHFGEQTRAGRLRGAVTINLAEL